MNFFEILDMRVKSHTSMSQIKEGIKENDVSRAC